MTKSRKPIAESRFYTLEVIEDETKRLTYGIINKEHKIIEAYVDMLPQALQYLEELDTALAVGYESLQDGEEFKSVRLH